MEYKWEVLTVTTLGILMAGIDSRIIMVGLPEVIAALGADAEQGIWITQSYLLGSTSALLLVGRLADIFGRKNIYTIGFAVFTIGSALTSLGTDPTTVILFRGLQGVGAGMIITVTIALITDATPSGELGMFLGINTISFRMGAVAGLTISGVILSFLRDWRALFYINIPIGIFGTYWAQRVLKEKEHKERKAEIDWAGFFTVTIPVTSFLLALTFATYGTEKGLVYSLLALSVAFVVAFVLIERRREHPLLDLGLLRIHEFTGGIIAQLLNAMAWGAVLLLLSFYFQIILDESPFEAGIRVVPFEMAFVAFGPLSGRLSDRYGHLPFTTLGIILTSIALYLFSTIGISTPYLYTAIHMMILGAGIGIFASPNMSSIMGSVPANRRGIASAFRSTFFNVGLSTSIGLSVLIMSFVLPYAQITSIISSAGNGLQVDKGQFLQAIRTTYLWFTVINAAALIPSVLRGRRVEKEEEDRLRA